MALRERVKEEEEEEEEEMRGSYVRAYSLALGALPSMVTRAACQLGIPDILHAQPLSALQITHKLPFPRQPPPPLHQTAAYLDRIMRFLCSQGVFKAHVDPASSSSSHAAMYSLTPISTWLLKPHGPAIVATQASSSVEAGSTCQANVGTMSIDGHSVDDTCPGGNIALDDLNKHVGNTCAGDVGVTHDDVGASKMVVSLDKKLSLYEFMLFQTCGVLQPPLQHLAQFILEGGEGPFYKAHGIDGWSFLKLHSDFSHLFNAAMACDVDISMALFLQNYQGFNDVHTLVDVGGGIGTAASRIVARYPSIRALNFDLPYVVASAPTYPGVEHIGGDMFQNIPKGDTIFIRATLHTWDDESCIKILKNCHKVLPKNGKIIIMEVVLSNDIRNRSPLNNLRVALDVLMMVNTKGGKERTNQEWEFILKAAKFQIYKVIELPCPLCIIEALPLYDGRNLNI